MNKSDYIDPSDWKYLEQKPQGDKDFSKEHNERVIKEVDEWNNKMDRKREQNHKEGIRERTSAVTQYLRQLQDGKGVISVNKYFGKRYLAYLRGQEIVKKLKENPKLIENLKAKYANKGYLKPL